MLLLERAVFEHAVIQMYFHLHVRGSELLRSWRLGHWRKRRLLLLMLRRQELWRDAMQTPGIAHPVRHSHSHSSRSGRSCASAHGGRGSRRRARRCGRVVREQRGQLARGVRLRTHADGSRRTSQTAGLLRTGDDRQTRLVAETLLPILRYAYALDRLYIEG